MEDKKDKKKTVGVIKCPKCGWEYSPSEIFIPQTLLGVSKNIIKNCLGEIEYIDGEEPDLCEEFICDHCNTTFQIKANISYESWVAEECNFNEDYSSKLPLTDSKTNLFEE